MPLSPQQIQTLLTLVVDSTEDDLTCDGCLPHVAQFAELELQGETLSHSMEKVKNHMQNCPCCKDEFNALMEALKNVDAAF